MIESSIALLVAFAGLITAVVAWRKAGNDRIQIVSESETTARRTATEAWEALAASQRATLEEYRERLGILTERVTELERELAAERERGNGMETRVRQLEADLCASEKEKQRLQQRIDELEGK